ncbi:coagulation factor V [Stegostoma tigrinum]|uniref:coagulation factor V n=1 Tax=Stegostoma tigrinum TaxID=3053191 RepID=UPI00202B5F2C|nr:coagulation factor V [Stegostoma tigrinum]
MKWCCPLLLFISCLLRGGRTVNRLHHLAAVEIQWTYSRDWGERRVFSSAETDTYYKIVYKEYRDADFNREKPGPDWRGLLGPILRAEVGDTLQIHFKNKASYPFNIRPQGIMSGQSATEFFYKNKLYFEDKKEPIIPNQEHTYFWNITEEMGPTISDPQCLTYTYSSDIDVIKDFHTGLIGALLICKPGSLKKNGKQNDFSEEFVLLFSIFDESKSWYEYKEKAPIKMYSINGFTNGTLPELGVCTHDDISWHLIGMSLDPEVFSIHFNGQVLLHNNHRVSSIGLTPGSSVTAEMSPIQDGKWLLSSQVQHHRLAGLYGYLNIKECTSKESPGNYRSRRLRRNFREYYIAAEEVLWDYAPDIQTYVDSDFKTKYLDSGPNRIGKIYKKAIYVEYTDETFSKRKEPNEGPISILQGGFGAPVIRTEVGDKIKVYFKNMASRPYSIYPHGITVDKNNEGAIYPGNSANSTKQVDPKQIHIYTWRISEDVGPTASDPRCLTRIYHSAVDVTRDIASGLFGPLLICKDLSLDARNLQIRVDEEQHIIFAALDENQSWYIDENIQLYLDSSNFDPTDPEFYESNIMYTVSGLVYESKESLPFCEGVVTYWHVSSIGAQDHIQAVYFHGHTFKHRKTNEDVLHLFPSMGETVTMQMDNLGEWLLGTLSSRPVTYGMRIRFKVYRCEDEGIEYPLVFLRIQSESDKVLIEVSEEASEEELDDESLAILQELGFRSFHTPPEAEEEDIFQYIEGETDNSRELNTKISEEQGSQFHSRVSGSQNKTYSEANKEKVDNLEYNMAQYELEQPKDLGESTSEVPLNEAINEMRQKTETESDAHVMNFTSSTVHLKQNRTATIVGDINVEIFGEDYEAKTNSSVLQDFLLRSAVRNTTLLFNMSSPNTVVNPSVKNKRSLAESPTGILKQNNFQLTTENISSVIIDGEREEKSDFVPQENNTELKSQNEETETLFEMRNTNSFNETSTISNSTGRKTMLSSPSLKQNVATSQATNFTPGYERNQINTNANNEGKSTLTVDVEQGNLLNHLSHEVLEHVTNTSEQPGMENSRISEKVFIYLKKYSTGKHRVRFQGTPLKPKGSHLMYQVEEKGFSVTELKHLKKYVKLAIHDNSTRKFQTKENVRRQTAIKTMLKRRKLLKDQMSPRGFKPGLKKRIHVPLGKKRMSPRGFHVKPNSIIYQDDSSNSIIIGIPKRKNGATLDYDEYIANADADLLGAARKNPEAATDLDSMNPYTNDRRTHSDMSRDPEIIVEHYLRSYRGNVRHYFIAAEEILWDYTGNTIHSAEQTNTLYKKVIFRRYTDALFRERYDHGERYDHLGILGPVIRAEVNDVIKVLFKNLASRPYSIHAHGVSYEKSSEGVKYEDYSTDWFRSDDAVPPNSTYTYVWNVPPRSAPTSYDSVCKAWVYYSSVDYVKDINSGLIGPLLICKKGTLNTFNEIPNDAREFVLLFNTFDETKSWYLNENENRLCKESCEISKSNSNFKQHSTFHAINGFVNASLRGLVIYEKEQVRWYLINMGGSDDAHTVRFHSQTFIERRESEHRLGIYNLYPGAFRTIEMQISKPGTWLLDCENGMHYKGGMRAHLLVLSKACDYPLGMQSGSITDPQITASGNVDDWKPSLARLHNSNMINAWSAEKYINEKLWIQVDLERPMVITELATQGASTMFVQNFIQTFFIEYSVDGENWKYYNGNSRSYKQVFQGNCNATDVKFNRFNPPIVARYLKLNPVSFKVRPTLRMELYGCEIDFCSQPLGMKSGIIEDSQITASSYWSSWWGSWNPSLARLDLEGRINAWRSSKQNADQWLQVNFLKKKRISSIITQGVRSVTTAMFVQTYAVHFSNDGEIWLPYTDHQDGGEKIFTANTDYYHHKKSYINPPIFAKYIRIIPKTWYNDIALRVEFFGCALE